MTASEIVKWCLVAWVAFGALATVALVGKPRQPISTGTAVTAVIVGVFHIVLLIIFWPAA